MARHLLVWLNRRRVSSSDTLNYTGLANETVWLLQLGTLWSVYREGLIETNYG
jgi:hypothetical protein